MGSMGWAPSQENSGNVLPPGKGLPPLTLGTRLVWVGNAATLQLWKRICQGVGFLFFLFFLLHSLS